MCRGAYRRPSLSRQPLVLGVKGKPCKCYLIVALHHFLIFKFNSTLYYSLSFINLLTKGEFSCKLLREVVLQFTDCFVSILWRPPEVGNGVGSAEELYADNGYDYYTNQGISQ